MALRNSCNIYFIQLGQRVGSSLFYDYFDAFGFTERTGVDLPNETNFMQYYNASQLGEVQLASSAFGQAMAVTPLQVCTAISARRAAAAAPTWRATASAASPVLPSS